MHSLIKLFQKTLRSFRKQPLLHLATISTIGVSCLILAFCLLVYQNLDHLAEQTHPYSTGTVYLKDGVKKAEVDYVKESILHEKDVVSIEFKSKQTVSKELQVFLGGSNLEIVPGSELFPEILEVKLEDGASPESIEALKSKLTLNPLVSGVDFSEDWLAQFTKIKNLVGSVGWTLIFILTAGCGFIIANFMGMRHQSRKAEMEIVQLIGANTSFILAPFLFEGVIEGLLGSALSLAFLYLAHLTFNGFLSSDWTSLLGISSWVFISVTQVLLLGLLGVTMALIGSLVVFFKTSEQFRT